MAQQLLTVSELASLLGVCHGTAYSHVQRGNIPATRLGNIWVIAASDAEHFKQNRRKAGRPYKNQ